MKRDVRTALRKGIHHIHAYRPLRHPYYSRYDEFGVMTTHVWDNYVHLLNCVIQEIAQDENFVLKEVNISTDQSRLVTWKYRLKDNYSGKDVNISLRYSDSLSPHRIVFPFPVVSMDLDYLYQSIYDL